MTIERHCRKHDCDQQCDTGGERALPDGFHCVEVSNLELIEACWGETVADQVFGYIQIRLRQSGFRTEQDRPFGRFRIVSDDRTAGPPDGERLASLPYRLTAEPISIELATGQAGAAVHAVISWRGTNVPRYRAPRDVQCDYGERWFAIYKSDMQVVAHAFRGAGDGRLVPHWQPVCDCSDRDRILYHEGLARFGDDSECLSPGVIFPALERTGMASAFDWIMVRQVLDELRADPLATLGVNISATSAHLGGWWREILRDLVERPDLAQRLIVEITETEPIFRIEETVAFARMIRGVGATLALDDFGAGFTTIRELTDLMPALVKVDGLFLQRAMRDASICHSLPHLIGLIRELGGTVIIEGVETQAMADLAYVSGAKWQQGFHYRRPSPVRLASSLPVEAARLHQGRA